MGRAADSSMIRPATPADVPVIMEIFEKAKAYMRQTGNLLQWNGTYPERSLIEEEIRDGHFYVMDCDGVHAVFACITDGEPTYRVIDGAWKTDGKAYATLHRVASDGTLHGVVAAACRFAGQHFSVIRIDTHRDNLPMRQALDQIGFQKCGIIYLADGDPRLAYELVMPTQKA